MKVYLVKTEEIIYCCDPTEDELIESLVYIYANREKAEALISICPSYWIEEWEVIE